MEYQKPYFQLFNAVTDALEALEAQNFGQARTLLVRAQQAAEESILAQEDEAADGP